jgi:hypothetical protein
MHRIPYPQLYTLKGMAARTRLPHSVIQRWGNLGVLVGEPDTVHSGKGVHRRFRVEELIVALLLRPFAQTDVPTGQLLRISGVLRSSINLSPGAVRGRDYEEGAPEIRRAILCGAYGQGDAFLAIGAGSDTVWLEPMVNEPAEDALWNLSAFYRGEGRSPDAAATVINLAVLRGVLGEASSSEGRSPRRRQ